VNPLHRRIGLDCPSELVLDQLVARELPAGKVAELDAHVGACAVCQQRRREREAERRSFQDLAPPLLPPAPAAPAAAGPRRRFARFILAAGVLAAAVALVPLLRHLQDPAGEITGVKGRQALRFFVLHDQVVREGRPGERVQPGDRLRFGLEPGVVAGRYAVILDRDATGKVSVFFPDRATPASLAALVPATEDGLLPYSIQLDDALGVEQLFVLLCREPIPIEPVRARLERAGAAPGWSALLAPGCTVEAHALEKQRSP
jgi:hypothetical protein